MAGGYSAPGVYRREIDLSDILVSTGISNGATVVRAKKGPVRRPVLVTNDKEYIETFGAPYYVNGLDDKNPAEAAIGGKLVPELGYGSYGAIEFLKESSTLFVVRAYDDGDKYSTVEVNTSATMGDNSGIVVSDSPLEVFDTSKNISTYEEAYQDGDITGSLLVGYVGPGEDGDNYAVTIETINPECEWLYSYDEYPVETSATQAKYGYDVPEVWIDGSTTIYEATKTVAVSVTPTSGGTPFTYDFIPENAYNYVTGDASWTVRSALNPDGEYQAIVPPVDVNATDWSSTVDSVGVWSVSGTVTDPDNVANTGVLSISGTYTSATGLMNGSAEQVDANFPIASEVIKVSVFKKSEDKTWAELYANKDDETAGKLRIEPLEVFYGTMQNKLDADGNELFIERSINGNSQFIYVKANGTFRTDASWDFSGGGFIETSVDIPTGTDISGFYVYNDEKLCKLGGGASTESTGLLGRDSEFWTYFENREELPVQIIINPSFSQADKLAVSELCNKRRDCVATNQVGNVKTLNYQDVINYEQYGYPSASFMTLYAGYSKVQDTYNDKEVYLPNSLFASSVFARVDRLTEPWYAPAGVQRATLSILDQNKIYSQDHIGKMYDRNINAIKYIQGAGFVIDGQKTAQLKKSALDRINVRRNLIYMQNNIENALNQFLFENNTEQTRLRVFSIVDEFLAGVKAGDGLYDYKVVCDESNNTSAVIDSNQLNIDIYVQPTKTIEFIQFTTVVTRTGTSFSDVQLKYA